MQKTAFCDRAMAGPDRSAAVAFPRSSTDSPRRSSRLLTKTLIVMKLFVVFMLAGLLQAQAESNAQTVTFSGKNVTITRVFKAIEAQTGNTVLANKDLPT